MTCWLGVILAVLPALGFGDRGGDLRSDLSFEAQILASAKSKKEFHLKKGLLDRRVVLLNQCEFERQSESLPLGCLDQMEVDRLLGLLSEKESRQKIDRLLDVCVKRVPQIQSIAELERGGRSRLLAKSRCSERIANRIQVLRYKEGFDLEDL